MFTRNVCICPAVLREKMWKLREKSQNSECDLANDLQTTLIENTKKLSALRGKMFGLRTRFPDFSSEANLTNTVSIELRISNPGDGLFLQQYQIFTDFQQCTWLRPDSFCKLWKISEPSLGILENFKRSLAFPKIYNYIFLFWRQMYSLFIYASQFIFSLIFSIVKFLSNP